MTFIDLFAGIGGFRLAFESCGATCVFSSELDKFAQKTYEANFGEKPFGDITKIDPRIIPDFDVLCAGFPCQPFSSIGKREGFNHETQGTLFYNIAEILRIKEPKMFLLENVLGLIHHEKGETLVQILRVLDRLDYNVHLNDFDSADFGVPQHRKRLYIVGVKKNLPIHFEWPTIPEERVGIGQFVETDVDGYEISEKMQKYLLKKHDGHPQIIDSSSDFPVRTLCASYYKIQRLTGTFVRGGKTGMRLLTANECKAIMGFPKDFIVPVSRTQMYHQFGNSVVVPVIKAIAEKIAENLNNCN